MRTLVFVPAVGLVAALFGSPSVASRETTPGTGGRPVQVTITSNPDRCDKGRGFADPMTGASQVQLTRIESKPVE